MIHVLSVREPFEGGSVSGYYFLFMAEKKDIKFYVVE